VKVSLVRICANMVETPQVLRAACVADRPVFLAKTCLRNVAARAGSRNVAVTER
jgi:hypothetical protein